MCSGTRLRQVGGAWVTAWWRLTPSEAWLTAAFSPLVSDVDLGLVLADPLGPGDGETVQAIADTVKQGASPLHDRLSIFWGTPSTLGGHVEGGRFPPLDRLDLLEHGRLLLGDDIRGDTARPSPAELFIVGAEFALDFLAGRRTTASPSLGSMVPGEDATEGIRQPELLMTQGPRRITKVILFRSAFCSPRRRDGWARTVPRWSTTSLSPTHPRRTWYGQPSVGGPIVQGPGATSLVNRELSPLYLYYIDDHVPRLEYAGRPHLSEAFRRWRSRSAVTDRGCPDCQSLVIVTQQVAPGGQRPISPRTDRGGRPL